MRTERTGFCCAGWCSLRFTCNFGIRRSLPNRCRRQWRRLFATTCEKIPNGSLGITNRQWLDLCGNGQGIPTRPYVISSMPDSHSRFGIMESRILPQPMSGTSENSGLKKFGTPFSETVIAPALRFYVLSSSPASGSDLAMWVRFRKETTNRWSR